MLSFEVIWVTIRISDLRSPGSWCIKVTDEFVACEEAHGAKRDPTPTSPEPAVKPFQPEPVHRLMSP